MRCPKCGYNSFDHLDSCKKCGKDLSEHKQRFGIVSVLFPGQMRPVDKSAAPEDESIVDDVVAVATASAVAAGVAPEASEAAEEVAATEPASTESSEADDFGFDFMGDSEEEEDLSFDELFEEASAEEDVEETLPSPEQEKADDVAVDEFTFDMGDAEDSNEDAELEDDFGFDPAAVAAEDSDNNDNLEAEDFELPPAEEDTFSFDTDNVEFEDSEDDSGAEEDPKDPFDLPESSLQERAPEEHLNLSVNEVPLDSVVSEEERPLLADPFADDEEPTAEDSLISDGFGAGAPGPATNSPDTFSAVASTAETLPDEAIASEKNAPKALAGDLLPDPEPSEPVAFFPEEPAVSEEIKLEAVAAPPSAPEKTAPIDPFLEDPAVSEEVEPGVVSELSSLAEELASVESLPEERVVSEESEPDAVASESSPEPDVPVSVAPLSDVPVASDDDETKLEVVVDSLTAGVIAETAASTVFSDREQGAAVDGGMLPATGSRIAAFGCDLLLLVVVGISFVVAAEAAISSGSDSFLPSMETLIDLSVPYFLVLFFLAFGYFTLFHFLAGQTPGKMLVGLRVETVAGEPLLFSQAFLRSVGGLLQVLPAGLGYLVILFSPDRRGWNDQLAGTRLVSLKGLSEDI